ncbi:MAG: hypothetical protein JXO51_00565 [Candidatus Aminicenantes bacterium]|nr:hypothetical protein [Candidatus Aminicenantes bacterium]
MGLNFREALSALSRALPLVLFRAGIFVVGGFAAVIFFGMLLLVLRPNGGAGPLVALLLALPILLGGWASGRLLQRFFLFRHRAAMLYLFSEQRPAAPGLAGALQETERSIPDHGAWLALNHAIGRAFAGFPGDGSAAITVHPVTAEVLGQAVLALAFSRGGTDFKHSIREGLALFFCNGDETRCLARRWLGFSVAGLTLLFLCLALPNWFLFSSVGAPVWIGMALAATIAWLLQQAFVFPFVLAGVSGALLAATRGHTPDPDLVEKLATVLP